MQLSNSLVGKMGNFLNLTAIFQPVSICFAFSIMIIPMFLRTRLCAFVNCSERWQLLPEIPFFHLKRYKGAELEIGISRVSRELEMHISKVTREN